MQYSSPRVRRVFLPAPLTRAPASSFRRELRVSPLAATASHRREYATLAPSVRSIRATVTFTEEPVQREKDEKLVRQEEGNKTSSVRILDL